MPCSKPVPTWDGRGLFCCFSLHLVAPPQQYSAVAAVSVVKTLPQFKLIYIQLAHLQVCGCLCYFMQKYSYAIFFVVHHLEMEKWKIGTCRIISIL